ncbi:MAG: hypothetical protein C4291_06115 [Candidatus Dadabacteria bacterium]
MKRSVALVTFIALGLVFSWRGSYADENRAAANAGSGAKTQQEQIDELKQMIEENQRQNQELQKRLEQLESERTGEKMKLEELKAKEEEKGAVSDLTNFLKSIKPGLYIDTSYEFNFNNPKSSNNQLRIFDTEHNAFNINLAQIYLERIPTIEGGYANLVGFRVKLDFGEDTDVFHARGLGGDEFDLQEAFIHVLAPVGKGLDIYVGKFVTLAGAEVIESKDNFNFSRSLLFGFAIPFTHTGIRLHYAAAPLDFTIGVNNGWDVVKDNNKGKTVEARIGLTYGIFSIGVVDYVGPEQDNSDSHFRNLIDVVASITPTKKLNLVANFDYGIEQKVTNPDLGLVDKRVSWWGIAGYIVYDLSDVVRLVLRGEYFDDRNGVRTVSSIATPISGTTVPGGKKYWELTPTLQLKPFARYKPFDNFIVRLEYRHDQANKDVFEKSNGDLRKFQDTIAAEFMYYFGY